MTPHKDIKEFARGEAIRADRMNEMRDGIVSLMRAFEAEFGPLDAASSQRPAMSFPVEVLENTTRTGIVNGHVYRPPIVPQTSGNFDTGYLGEQSTLATGSGGDVELWDFSMLKNTGVGHLIGYNSTGKPILLVDRRVGVVVAVDLIQTGGSNGNLTTAATWTYTVKDKFGTVLATGASPEWPRENGTRTAATKGQAYRNTAGTITLSVAFEKPGTGGC